MGTVLMLEKYSQYIFFSLPLQLIISILIHSMCEILSAMSAQRKDGP